MKNFTLLILFTFLTFQIGFSQDERYLDDVFTDVTLTENVIYGVNATVAPRFFQGATEALPRPLNADIYMPAGDTETARPLVILLHTGNFVPFQINGGCGGTVKDNDMVNFANRLAKKGYVVAVADYRIGWNPADPAQINRVFLLINAAYRGVQDVNTAVRFFKKTVAEDNNPYGVDPNKIAVWGFGTGGYIAYGASFLQDVQETYIPKFFLNQTTPMIIEGVNGDVEGKTVGIALEAFPGFVPEGDTLNYPNHVDYSSKFQLGVAAGGANGDTSWIDGNDIPFIGFQVKTDPFAPCGTDVLDVPPPIDQPVVEVMGSCTSLPLIAGAGLNNVFDVAFIDDVSLAANTASGDVPGFFPFSTSDEGESAPWNFHLTAEPYGVEGSDCPTDAVSAQIYADSMMAYFAPRACLALDLGCNLDVLLSNQDLDAAEVGLSIMPNPAQVDITFVSEKEVIQHVYVYDITGRLVKAHTDINNFQFTMQRNNLSAGLYMAQVKFETGIVTQKIAFN